jgi:hypothetical protein
MAEHKPGVEGNVAGKPITHALQTKIHDVLQTTLKAELSGPKPTIAGGRHGSITHGSVIFEE